MPKKKARKKTGGKRARRPQGAPARVRVLVVLMIVAVAAGIALVKFFQTTRGRVLLVDTGFTGYYSQVQAELDDGLRRALAETGLARSLEENRGALVTGGERLIFYEWRVVCGASCDFVDVNLEITRAVRRAGGIVRSGVERNSNSRQRSLVFDIGSRRYTTHKITVERSRKAGVASRWNSAASQPSTERDRRSGDRGDRRTRAPRAALVFDDFGYSKSRLVEAFLTLELPITISVIPSLPHSRYAVSRARANGKEPMLHLPMEAEEGPPSDVAAVLVTMSDGEIRELVGRYLEESPGVVGVNNHQGSRATQDRRVMRSVLSVIKGRRLFFLDSLTSGKSIAYNTAREMGVPAARNGVFLDADTEDPLVIEERLLGLLETARERGTAIAIGHPRSSTYQVLERNLDVLKDSGVEFVFLSQLVE
ncbi:MAG: divergent polysaccharide deacetylase family protein [Candidatus Krumholzibacteriia bacterium]